jgi:hypothetical protein
MAKRALIAALLTALALPGIATAKELEWLRVCGSSGCARSSPGDERARAAWAAFGNDDPDNPNGGIVQETVAPRAYYKLGVRIVGDDGPSGRPSVELWYAEPGLFKWVDNRPLQPFRRLNTLAVVVVRDLARGLKPFPASRVIGATVDGKRVAEPGSGGTVRLLWLALAGPALVVPAALFLLLRSRRRPRPEPEMRPTTA